MTELEEKLKLTFHGTSEAVRDLSLRLTAGKFHFAIKAAGPGYADRIRRRSPGGHHPSFMTLREARCRGADRRPDDIMTIQGNSLYFDNFDMSH